MQDKHFISSLDDLEDGLNGLIETKITQFDLYDEDELIRAIRGVSSNISTTNLLESLWSGEGGTEGLWDFSNVESDTNSAPINFLSNKKEGNKGGQCGSFVNRITKLGVGDSYDSKMARMDKSIKSPKAGMIFTMPYKKTGHCGFIVSIENGIATVKDSNWSLDEKIKTHTIPVNKMTGFAYYNYLA